MARVLKKPQAVADLESAIVRRIQGAGELSRVELSRALKVVASTTGIYVDRLVADGFLVETSGAERGLGRPPVLLRLNPRAGRFVGVDFDARQIQAVSVDFAQNQLVEARRMIPAKADAQGVLSLIADAIRAAAGRGHRRDLLGIGLGVPGLVDPPRGMSLRYNFLPDWVDVPIGPLMAEQFGVPVSLENNLRAMALAELHSAAAQGARNLVCIGIRSGIGSGVVADGQLLTGATNQAGEIGRWIYPPAGRLDGVGRPQTIEDIASVSALLAKAGLATADELLGKLQLGDRQLERLVTAAARVHAWTAHQLVALLDCERLVVATPLLASDAYRRALFAAAERFGGQWLSGRLYASELGPFAGALGAAALAFQNWRPQR